MSATRWRLDGLAFTIALEAMDRDRLPYPLSYQPEFMERLSDFERLRQRRARELQAVFDERLYKALTVLLEPQVRIEIHGFYGPDLSRVVRMHAGIVDRIATLAIQQHGPTRDHGLDIVVGECHADTLVTDIAANLPQSRGGTHPAFSARRSDLDHPIYSRHPTPLSPTEEINQFLRRPHTSTGEITVYPGIAYDARPTDDGHPFIWLDYPDDGRYLLHNHNQNDFTIAPGPSQELMHHSKAVSTPSSIAEREPPPDNPTATTTSASRSGQRATKAPGESPHVPSATGYRPAARTLMASREMRTSYSPGVAMTALP
ncbi:ESX secretion-associated protein EspG [Nocardia sp. KC 131]|uniref:ESX secretion-associated protein EspG n=1 Tax=Nocardia arseniciresistens TaxID=3392119 RepID=UPI00398EEFE5